ncbi:hypothetical protein MLD38_017932 [Melastoma candidum]|uniref:Uncharacterized protein n=1 Tax=Melastoma candidum TaxID=119954 RepID=A0ACB9QTJ0_9MYRT|nr:hypothetical protein MLD38_017932 [Melastoma candidum]
MTAAAADAADAPLAGPTAVAADADAALAGPMAVAADVVLAGLAGLAAAAAGVAFADHFAARMTESYAASSAPQSVGSHSFLAVALIDQTGGTAFGNLLA